MDVVMELYEDKPISVQLPDQIEATIVEADAVVKGQTACSSYKPAILDNGVRVLVPPHITAVTPHVVDVYADRNIVVLRPRVSATLIYGCSRLTQNKTSTTT